VEALLGIFSAFGLSASAGLNAYIPLLVVALLARFTNLVQLKPPFDVLTSWWIIGLLVVLIAIEFFVDKAPAVNHINDGIQTFVRPVAGAIVFAGSAQIFTELHPVLALAAGLLTAGAVHTVKSVAIRPAVTATTAGIGNTPVSILEDVAATVLSILSIVIPILIFIILLLILVLLVWFLWKRANASRPAGGSFE
jgi:hypothetical protein